MASPDKSRHIEIKDDDQTVAAAEVTAAEHAEGTVRTSLHANVRAHAPGQPGQAGRCGHGPARGASQFAPGGYRPAR
jgi:hypothetical protein